MCLCMYSKEENKSLEGTITSENFTAIADNLVFNDIRFTFELATEAILNHPANKALKSNLDSLIDSYISVINATPENSNNYEFFIIGKDDVVLKKDSSGNWCEYKGEIEELKLDLRKEFNILQSELAKGADLESSELILFRIEKMLK